MGIRPNGSDYLWSQTKLIEYLVDYHEFSDNQQDKTKRLLSLETFMQIKTNPKVRSNPKGLSFLKSHPMDLAVAVPLMLL